MLFDRIDIQRLRRDIAATSAQCIDMKRLLRRRWEAPMADEQRRLVRLRRRLTELHVLLARARGRFHVATPPHEVRQANASWDREAWSDRVAGRVALDYALAADAQEVKAS
ncbi:MAG: hypothetical protein IT372_34140 [Polyangiaceae bacterium]|nr:hypothetical protein [Polyangiaceae bacterium]